MYVWSAEKRLMHVLRTNMMVWVLLARGGIEALNVPTTLTTRSTFLKKALLETMVLPAFAEEEPGTGISGLVRFPPLAPLRNEYVLVRAAECEMEKRGVIMTNAAFKMSQSDCSLTEDGLRGAYNAAKGVEKHFTTPLVYYDTGRASQATAEVIASELQIHGDRMVPEYLLLEARGFGAHEGERLVRIPELHDHYDKISRYLKPPEGEDGAYAESIEDVVCRFRQVLSKIETMHCGEKVVLIAPGRDYFAIGATAFTGVDPRSHVDLPAFSQPGAVISLQDAANLVVPTQTTLEPGPFFAEEHRTKIVEPHRRNVRVVASDLNWAIPEARREAKLQQIRALHDDFPPRGPSKPQNLPSALATAAVLGGAWLLSIFERQQLHYPTRGDDVTNPTASSSSSSSPLKPVPAPVRVRQPALDPNGDLYFTKVHDYGPCPPGDDLCLASYLNEDDDAWIRNIQHLRANPNRDLE